MRAAMVPISQPLLGCEMPSAVGDPIQSRVDINTEAASNSDDVFIVFVAQFLTGGFSQHTQKLAFALLLALAVVHAR